MTIEAASTSAQMGLAEIVALLGVDVVWVSGTLDRTVWRISSLNAASDTALTFCRYDDHRLDAAVQCAATAVIVPASRPIEAADGGPTLIAVANPRLSFIRVASRMFPRTVSPGVHSTALIHPTAFIDASASIGPFVVIGPRCTIGAGSSLGARVVLQQDVRVGANTRVDTGTVIGGEGFGFERAADGALENFPHVGGVVIGDNVDIGCNVCIDRGTLEDTVIGNGVRIDNLTHISHNCRIGDHAVVVCLVTLCGSTVVGERAWVSPNASVLNQLTVGAGAYVGMGAVVVKSVAGGKIVVGNPAKVLEPKT